MGTYVLHSSKATNRMIRHVQCLLATRRLEEELFGEVSPSVAQQIESYGRWQIPTLPDPGSPALR